MHKRLNIRLYPTKSQEEVLQNHFDGYRFVYNLCLEYKRDMYKWYGINKSGYDMQAELFKIRKETDWLKKCKAECIANAALQVDKSFKNFFSGKGFPKFKSKHNRQSFTSHQAIRIKKDKLSFFKNLFKFRCSEKYRNLLAGIKIKQCTFIRTSSGKYYASCLVDIPNEVRPYGEGTVGIDMGLSHFIITSDGIKVDNPKHLEKSLKKLKTHSRRLSRKVKGSNNRNKQRIKLSKVHEKIANQRKHFLHEVSNMVVNENQVIAIEDLNVRGMQKNRRLSKAISSVSWGEFRRILEYKCNWYGRELHVINRFFPSSKTCSNCGHKHKELKLSDRTFNCPECGFSIDRDLNAAINLKNQIPGKTGEFTPVDSEMVDERSYDPKKLTLCEAGT